jgi:hypothetical protein
MGIRAKLMRLRDPSKGKYPLYRYGMLAYILVMSVWQIELYLTRPADYEGDPYGGFVCVLMLLFGHLAMAFKWRRGVAIALWVLTSGWIVFGFFYVFYWSHVLYP